MTDLALQWNGLSADLVFEDGDLQVDETMLPGVLLSLFTDGYAEAGDTIPDGSSDRRGFWADAYAETEGDRTGSRLWLLERAKNLPHVVNRVRDFDVAALRWLTDDGVAREVSVTAAAVDSQTLSHAITIDGETLENLIDIQRRTQ